MSAALAAIAARRAPPPPQVRSGEVLAEHADGSVTISETQRRIHVTSEAFAVAVAAPITAWIALKKNPILQPWERGFLGVLAAGTIIVDGGLLVSWLRRRKKG